MNMRGDEVSTEGFLTIKDALAALDTEVRDWHFETYGVSFDNFAKGPEQEQKKERYRQDTRFKQAFDFFGIDWEQHRSKIYLPWWNELGASRIAHERFPDGCYTSTFVPMHPFELQLVKGGVNILVQTTSTDGILIAQPDADSKEGYVVLGVRTGSGHPNTYHVVPAGYLQASPAFIHGKATLYENFVQDELTPESGLMNDDIEEARPLAVIHDYLITNGGPEYIFLVRSKLTKKQILERWKSTRATDRQEHSEFVFVPADKASVNEFIAKNYVGSVANRHDRNEHERYILQPAALALAAYSGMPLSELKSYCNGKEN
jgi:hypothetical protein